jgi:hypothetical protein
MKEITITNLTGTAPYNIYLCDTSFNGCVWMTSSDFAPVSFMVPPPYDTNTSFGVRIVDVNNCTVEEVVSL